MIQVFQAIGIALAAPPTVQAPCVVPIEIRQGMVCVSVTVNGTRKCTFELDTGASMTNVTQDLGKALLGQIAAVGAQTMLNRLQIGSIVADKVPVVVMADHVTKNLAEWVGKPIDGLLSVGVLGRVRMALDYRRAQLLIWPAQAPISTILRTWFARAAAPKGAAKLPRGKLARQSVETGYPFAAGLFPMQYGQWSAEGELGGTVLDFMLDTGNLGDCADVDSEVVGLLRGAKKTGSTEKHFFTGEQTMASYVIAGICFAGRRLKPVERIEAFNQARRLPAGLNWVGSDLLAGIRSLWDFSGGVFYFAPYAGSKLQYSPTPVEAALAAQERPRMCTPDGVVIRLGEGANFVPRGSSLRGTPGAEVFCTSTGDLYVVIKAGSPKGPKVARCQTVERGPGLWWPPTSTATFVPADIGPIHVAGGWRCFWPPSWKQTPDPMQEGGILLVPPHASRRAGEAVSHGPASRAHGAVVMTRREPDGTTYIVYGDGTVEKAGPEGKRK